MFYKEQFLTKHRCVQSHHWGASALHFILFYLTISIIHRNNLHFILLSKLEFPLTNPTVSESLSSGLFLNRRLDFNIEIMEFQQLFLFSFVLESVFHEHEVSSLNINLEGVSLHKGIHL